MPREFAPPLTSYFLREEHIGKRFWIVKNDSLRRDKLVGKPIPDEKRTQRSLLLLSGVLLGYTDRDKRPVFGDFLNKDGEAVVRTGGRYPDEDTHTYFPFAPVEIVSRVSEVKKETIMKTLGVDADMLGQEDTVIRTNANANANASRRASATWNNTNLLLDTLMNGESRQTVTQILQRKDAPDLTVIRRQPVSYVAALHLLPKGMTKNDILVDSHRGSQTKAKNLLYQKDCIGILIDSTAFDHDQKRQYLRLLLEKGADPSISLVLAVAKEEAEFVRILLDAGADPNTVTSYFMNDVEFHTAPLLAATPETLVFTGLDTYNRMVPDLQRHAFVQMRTVVDELLKTRESTEETGTLVTETFVSKQMLSELRDRLAVYERDRETKAKDKAEKLHPSWYDTYIQTLTYILSKAEEVSIRQRMAPGFDLAEKAEEDAIAHGFRHAGHVGGSIRKNRRTQRTRRNKPTKPNRRTTLKYGQ